MIAKLSGIGCSSKTPTYFVERRARLQLRARPHAGDRHRRQRRQPRADLHRHLRRRRLALDRPRASSATPSAATCDMLYVIENNGVYGLTKGQFSASADVGSKSKRGEANRMAPIDPVLARPAARRDLRRAQLLGRQGAAGADPQGGARAPRLRAHRRHLAVRDLQRSRRLDQELRQHAQAQLLPVHRRRLRAARDGDHRRVRAGHRDRGDHARRQRGALPQAAAD